MKLKHCEAFKAFTKSAAAADTNDGDEGVNGGGNKKEDAEDESLKTPESYTEEVSMDVEGVGDEFLTMTCDPESDVEGENEDENEDEKMNEKADEVFKEWTKHNKVSFGKYPFDGKYGLKRGQPNNILELISKFDTIKYFRMDGTKKNPSISVFARIHFSTMHNAAFQSGCFLQQQMLRQGIKAGQKLIIWRRGHCLHTTRI